MCGRHLTHAKERKEEGVAEMEGEERFVGKALAALITIILLIPVIPIVTEGDIPQANIDKTVSMDNFYVENKIIKLADTEFDVNFGPANLPYELLISMYQSEVNGYYIVQFNGPVQELWKAELKLAGAKVCNYVPYNAFIVQMSQTAKAAVESLPFVQYVGIYQPAFKLPAYLLEDVSLAPEMNIIDGSVDIGYENAVKKATGLGDSSNRIAVTILLHDRENPNSVATFICKAGGKVTGVSENSIRAEVSRNGIQSLAYMNGVRYISQYHEPQPMMADTTWTVQSKVNGVNSIWNHGIWGNWSNFPTSSWGNITIGIADTGLNTDHEMFYHPGYSNWVGDSPNHRKVLGYYQLGDNYVDYDGHGTHICGIVAGNGTYAGSGNANRHGMAPSAKISFCDIGRSDDGSGTNDATLKGLPQDLKTMYALQKDDGASLSLNPWCAAVLVPSYDPPFIRTWMEGNYTDDCENSDEYMWLNKEFQIFFPAGNDRGSPGGPFSTVMMPPATAKNVVSVAATYSGSSWYDLYSFSSWGATDSDTTALGDGRGRLKPDVGTVGGMDSAGNDGNRDGTLDSTYGFITGTSQAAACAAGATALIAQYYRQGWYPVAGTVPVLGNGFVPSNALLKATLINGCMDSTFGSYANDHDYVLNGVSMNYPNTDQGWGMVHLDDSLYFSGDAREMWVDDYKSGFITGQSREYHMQVATGQPLEISLVWTDYKGSGETAGCLVNDLDLTVIGPGGIPTYRGNNYGSTSRESDSGSLIGVDHTNNIECALIKTPIPGTWTIYVNATNIPVGPQPYALVVTGNFDDGYGWVKLDKSIYHVQDTITVEVEDVNAGAGPLTATLTSSTGDVETITLTQVLSNAGRYTGTINTKFEYSLVYSGNISIENNGWLSVRYADFSPVHASYANATTDASTPHITNVYVTDIESNAATIHWDTDVPSTSQVYYGNTTALGSNSTIDNDKMLHHQVTVGGLTSFTTYYFDVESKSIVDGTTRDTNGEEHYMFQTDHIGDVLLVIGGDDEAPQMNVQKLLENYTNALVSKNWSNNVWQTRISGDPTLSLLQSYKAVIWQVNLETYPPFSDAQRTLVTDYNNGGGRLWVVSHDVAWSFGDPTAQDYTVERFQWHKAQLKAYWVYDDSTFTILTGNASDPISGNYTGGVAYVPFRSGGAGDQVGHNQTEAGGWVEDIWFSNGAHSGRPCGIRWWSFANNGTTGVGVWGGTPTKIVVYFFEWSRITNQYAKSDILDKTLKWLIGSGPPSVQVTYPNGGNVVSGTTPITWTNGGTINSQEIQISKDGGLSWIVEATGLPGAQTSYDWDTAKQSAGIPIYPNGPYYRVKVIANGPILSTADISDSTFSVNNGLSGDKTGPVIQAGSIKPSPIPVGRTLPLNVTAIADDRAKGNSNINVIEVYVDGTAPGNKRGNMNPIDVFDSPLEKGYINFTVTQTFGNHTLYVRAQDVAGNWGAFESAQFYIIFTFIGPPMISLSNPNGAEIWAGGQSHTIWWNMSDIDTLNSQLLVNLSYSSTGPSGPWTDIATDLTGFTDNPCSYNWDVPPLTSSNCFVQINVTDSYGLYDSDISDASFTIDSTPPQPATNFRAELTGNNHVTLYWTPSASSDIAYYQIWSMTNGWDASAIGYSLLYQTPNNANTTYTHGGQGNFSGNEVCYQLRVFDKVGYETRTIVQAAKFTKIISASATVSWGGWIMLGSFLTQSSYEVNHKLQGQGMGMNGFYNWSAVELYNAWDTEDSWKVNVRNATAGQNEIATINNTQGFWLCAYNAVRYTSAGYITNMSIPMKAGWNHVPYPFAARNWNTMQIRDHLIANCPGFGATFNDMEIMNRSAQYRLMMPTGTEILNHQDAFWVRVNADCTWNVIN
jgi:hypothetical protein